MTTTKKRVHENNDEKKHMEESQPLSSSVVQEEEEEEQPVPQKKVYSAHEIEAILISSPAMNYVMRILINGKNAYRGPHSFPFHEGFMLQMENSYRRGDYTAPEGFFHALTLYLDGIPQWTPQCGKPFQGKQLVDALLKLAEEQQVGYLPIIKKILSTRMAPSSL